MTSYPDPETIVAAWLDEGPLELPEGTRRAIITSLPTIHQARHRTLLPWLRRPAFGPSLLGVAAVLATIAIAGIVAFAGLSHPTPSPTPLSSGRITAGPTAAPQSPLATTAAGQTFSPQDGAVTGFAVNFTYHLPPDPGIIVNRTETGFWQFRIPRAGVADAYDGGVIVRAVTGGHADPCAEFSSIVPFPAGAQPVMDYLATVPSVTLTNVRAVTIDGRPALQASMHIGVGTAACPDLWLWNGAGSVTQNGGRPTDIDLRVIDIDGRHIAMYTVGALPWSTGQEIVDSFRFDAPPPSGSLGP